MDDESSDFVTIDEIMENLNVGRNTVYALLKNKQIEAFRIGRIWKIPYCSLEKFIKENSTKKLRILI